MADDIILGAKQFPNPSGITPKLDTEPADLPDKITARMDISNPPPLPAKPHPLEEHFKIQPRTHTGRGVPKKWLDQRNIKVTEN